jgi:hypothetical protein
VPAAAGTTREQNISDRHIEVERAIDNLVKSGKMPFGFFGKETLLSKRAP